MNPLFILVVYAFYLLVFSVVSYVVYKHVPVLPYYRAIRTWLVTFYAEIVLLMFFPAGICVPGLPTLCHSGGAEYLMSFTELSLVPDAFLLLLLPLVPALVVYFYTRH